MQIQKRILVGARNGKRVINWPVVAWLGLVVGIVSGASGAGTWFLLTGEFSLTTIFFPIPLGVGFWNGHPKMVVSAGGTVAGFELSQGWRPHLSTSALNYDPVL